METSKNKSCNFNIIWYFNSIITPITIYGKLSASEQLSIAGIFYWTNCPLHEFSIGPIVYWTNCLLDQLSIGRIVYWTNCLSDELSIGPIVFGPIVIGRIVYWTNCLRTNCPRTKINKLPVYQLTFENIFQYSGLQNKLLFLFHKTGNFILLSIAYVKRSTFYFRLFF